jgi:hypothetical protein
MFSIKDKRQDIRFTKQISVTRISNLPSKFHVLFIFSEKRDFNWGAKMVEWGRGHGGWWGGGLCPPVI